jgi:hypothetical protein
MGESKAYNITAAPQQTPYNPRSQEKAKYNKRTVAHGNRVSIGYYLSPYFWYPFCYKFLYRPCHFPNGFVFLVVQRFVPTF